MKVKIAFIFILIILFLVIPVQAQFYFGTCEGYIKNGTGNLMSGAQVNVTVVGCTTEGCNASTTSDAGGYYVVANLNLAAGETVTVSAYHPPTSGSGGNTGTADGLMAAFVNVTLCKAPSPPVLTPEPDTHYTNATLYWTSGIDPDNLTTHDRYQLDSSGVVENATSPQYEFGLSYATHTWKVQTCNPTCCSNWVSDTFVVYNSPPSQPTLTDQPNTINNTVTLYWTSGTDPEGDSVYDQYQFDSTPITNATSPQTETNLSYGSHTWKVRTCDEFGACSSWSTDTFSIINNPCPAPILVPEPDTHFDNTTLEWTSNATDIDGDPCHDRYQFDTEPIVDPATSPQTEYNLTWGSAYTWRVQSCDNKGACSSWQSDTFSVTNNPPSAPVLTDQNHTDASAVVLYWTSGTDPENDTTYDQYQFNSDPVKNATSPQIEQTLGYVQNHTWRVRTCDEFGSCSSWVTDLFIKYSCPPCPPCPPSGPGVGIPGTCPPQLIDNKTVYVCPPNVTIALYCNESWVCESWEPCSLGGLQTRECVDVNECRTTCFKPETWQTCLSPPIPRVEVPVFMSPPWMVPSLMLNILLIAIIVGLVSYILSRREARKGRRKIFKRLITKS